MFVRLALGAMLACGMVTLDAASAADNANARTFVGRTAQRHRLKLKADGGALKMLRFDAELRCRDGSTLVVEESGFLPTPLRAGGAFRDAQFGRTDAVRFRGHVGARQVRGRLRVTDELRGGIRCKSRWIAFKAASRGGRS